jgi:ABC-type xylose transport system permease subunit
MWSWLDSWISTGPILAIAGAVFVLMFIALVAGYRLRRRRDRTQTGPGQEATESAVIAVSTLLALLLGFTFNLALERFEARRLLVVDQANAIDAAYLHAQLLPEPHRRRISDILVAFTDNRIALATAEPSRKPALQARNEALLADLWAATSAARGGVGHADYSNAFLQSVGRVVETDNQRQEARLIHVPSVIFEILFAYMIVTCGLLGYLLTGVQGKTSVLVVVLMTIFLLLVIDIDRPTEGAVRESQAPMALLRAKFAQPRSAFDRYRSQTAVRAAGAG